MSDTFDKISQSLNVETEIVKAEDTSIANVSHTNNDIQKDYEYTRANLYSLIEKGQEAINGIMELAGEGGSPRAYEVAGQLIKNVADTTDKLIDLQKKLKEVEEDSPKTTNHTKDHELAKDIALQHLDEIPDYYTRLKKMEASAKKEHKKFKDVKMNEEGLRDWFGKSKSKDGKPGWVNVVTGGTCASDEPEEGTPKCVSSAKRASMSKAERLSAARRKKSADPGQQQKSGAAKPTYVSTDKPKKKMKEELELQEAEKKAKKDACYNKVKSRYSVWPSAYASGALVKCRKVGAANWGNKSESVEMVRYCPGCKKNEMQSECKYGSKFWEAYSQPAQGLTDNQMKFSIAQVHPANEEKDHEYSMARSELSTIISAAKRLKKKVGKGEGSLEAWVQSKITKAADYIDTAADYLDSGQGKVDESTTIEDANGNTFAQVIDIVGPNHMQPVVDEDCWKGYKQVGMKKKGPKIVPNCVKEEYSNWREELSEDWQSVNRKDKTDGLSQKAVKAYRRENPGSKLQTAVTEKKPKGKRAKRRASFCRRMSGMKEKLTSAETARDSDSNINKALRRWNCN